MKYLHLIIPGIVYLFKRDKVIFFGLLLGNFADLDHWFGLNRIFHSNIAMIVALIIAAILLGERNKPKYKLWFWITAGFILHLVLDAIAKSTGVYI